MKFLTQALVIYLGIHALAMAQDKPNPPKIYLAAVGENPVPRLVVKESDGFTGYVIDEGNLPKNLFHHEWKARTLEREWDLSLQMNQVAQKLELKVGEKFIHLAPEGSNLDDAKKITLDKVSPEGLSLLLVYNGKPDADWKRNYRSRLIPCSVIDPLKPVGMLVNLTSLPIYYYNSSMKQAVLAPGAVAKAGFSPTKKSGYFGFRVGTIHQGKPMDLSLQAVSLISNMTPVIAVIPSVGANRKTRPIAATMVSIPHGR